MISQDIMQEYVYAYIYKEYSMTARQASNIITQLLILDVFCQTQTLKEILDGWTKFL